MPAIKKALVSVIITILPIRIATNLDMESERGGQNGGKSFESDIVTGLFFSREVI